MTALMHNSTPATVLDASFAVPQGTVAEAMCAAHHEKNQRPEIAPEDYKPEPIPHKESADNWFGGKLTQFQLKKIVQEYYGPHRFMGYVGSAMYPELVHMFEKRNGEPSKANVLSAIPSFDGEKFGNSGYNEKKPAYYTNFNESLYDNKEKDLKPRTPAKKMTLMVEAGVFTGLSICYAHTDMNKLINDNRAYLAVEFDKNPKNINALDVLRSKNNILNTQANKWLWRTASHTASGLAYLHNLTTALVASAANITLERFMISSESAYDMAEKLVNKVQVNHFSGEVTKENVVNGLQEIMQQMRIDHHFNLVRSDDFQAIQPVLGLMAEDIMNEKLSLAMVIECLGGGNIIPGNNEQSEKNYHYIVRKINERDPEGVGQSTRLEQLREGADTINTRIDGNYWGYKR
jgi:hypothetical protein